MKIIRLPGEYNNYNIDCNGDSDNGARSPPRACMTCDDEERGHKSGGQLFKRLGAIGREASRRVALRGQLIFRGKTCRRRRFRNDHLTAIAIKVHLEVCIYVCV